MIRHRPIAVGGFGVGLAGVGLYRARRYLFARWLRLPPPKHAVMVERNLAVTMEDGAVLLADHYYPKAPGNYPTVLIRSVYGRGFDIGSLMGRVLGALWLTFAERGYHVVVQTTRGRYDSGGHFEPLSDSAGDGRTTVQWIARQPWFNGSLGMWGQSALGYVQWAIAAQNPPELKAIIPTIMTSNGYSIVYPDGAFALDAMLRWAVLVTTVGGNNARLRWEFTNRFRAQTQEERLQTAFMKLPLTATDAAATGQAVDFYQNWLARPDHSDPYWQNIDHSNKIPELQAKPHMVSGWYDFLLGGLVNDYNILKATGKTPYLTIGPWHHFNIECIGESLREGLNWLDAHLKGDTSRLRPKPVRIYVMGADEWRDLESWPPPSQPTRYYLQAGGQLATEEAAEDTPPDHYRYDPANPTPVIGGAIFNRSAGAQDQRPLEARPDVLCYTTPPLTADLEVIGALKLELYVRSSLEHTDFVGRLCDVYPDGRSINICDGFVRLAPGKGQPQPDGSLRIEFELWPTAYRFRAGHRIRLQVASGAHPRWNRNLGTGEPPVSATRMLAADQTIYHSRQQPSALILPVV